MSLKYALLGFIDVFPDTSGYDLKKYFEVSVNYYWSATHSQIYRTLDELNAEGFINQRIINQEDKPNRKVYTITENGKNSLVEWLKQPADLPAIRHELLVKLSYAAILPRKDILNLLEHYKQEVLDRLQTYQINNQRIVDNYTNGELEKYLWQLCLDSGFIYYRGELEWLEKAITKLKTEE